MVTEEVKLLKTLVSDLEKELKTKGNRKRFFIRVASKNDLQKTYGIFQMSGEGVWRGQNKMVYKCILCPFKFF